MSDLESARTESSGSEMLRGFWYPALRSREVRRGRLRQAMLLGIPLVVGRDASGNAFALRDSCPHRGMPLSAGRVVGDTVQCAYHGWRFSGATGRCEEIPSLVPGSRVKVDRIVATCFACEEQDGYVWVYVPNPGERGAPPERAPALPVFGPRYRMTHFSETMRCNPENGIIQFMDPAHNHFVHRTWWWRARASFYEKAKVFEPVPNGFRMATHAPSRNRGAYRLLAVYGEDITTTTDFLLPNHRNEVVRCGRYWFSARATVTPLDADHCRVDFLAAWNIFRGVPFVAPLFRLFGGTFLRQDKATIEKQAEGLRHTPVQMLIDDADRPTKWFLALKAAYLEAQKTGRPIEHPLAAPVTLRWRS